jgi:hypothetical protein
MFTELSIGYLVSGLVGGIVSQLTKSVLDCIFSSDLMIKISVESNMKMIDPIQLDKSNLVVGFEVQILIDKIVSEIISTTHGVFVFAAPQGIGKSTYLKMAAIKLQLNHPNIKLKLIKNGGPVLQNQNLNILLKVPSGRALSDYLPNNSVIILDQIDFKLLN